MADATPARLKYRGWVVEKVLLVALWWPAGDTLQVLEAILTTEVPGLPPIVKVR